MDSKAELALYREQMGDEATMRQLVAGQDRYPCCWNLYTEGHHPDCKKHPKKRAAKAYREHFGDDATEGASSMLGSPQRLSRRGALFIARFEGFVPTPYNDAAGNATIGYGHLLHYGRVTYEDNRRWGHISRERGLLLLQHDAEDAAHCILHKVHPAFVFQHRFDALCSFVFNLGCGILNPGHNIADALNSGRLRRGAANALLLYDRAGGKVLPGLQRRRRAERALFLYGLYRNRYVL